jgi:hypothetical protein
MIRLLGRARRLVAWEAGARKFLVLSTRSPSRLVINLAARRVWEVELSKVLEANERERPRAVDSGTILAKVSLFVWCPRFDTDLSITSRRHLLKLFKYTTGASNHAGSGSDRTHPSPAASSPAGLGVPGRAVFGVSLETALSIAQIANLPAIIFRCIEYLEAKKAAEEEGIYRLSGSSAVIKALKDRFNHGKFSSNQETGIVSN